MGYIKTKDMGYIKIKDEIHEILRNMSCNPELGNVFLEFNKVFNQKYRDLQKTKDFIKTMEVINVIEKSFPNGKQAKQLTSIIKEKNMQDSIVNTVIDKFKSRSELGIKKYGTTLEKNSKDNFLNHLQEELMDATLYVEKLRIKEKVLEWAKEKNLLNDYNAPAQLAKIVEEVGEMSSAHLKNNIENLELEIGDVIVTLIIFAAQKSLDFDTCLFKAFEKIKDRQGKTENGTFIKETKDSYDFSKVRT
jgi:NTP pyrophosphatase (non-canonical NTP hydrolase)